MHLEADLCKAVPSVAAGGADTATRAKSGYVACR